MAELQKFIALQNFVNCYGFGISKEELASKAYRYMKATGHEVCIVNTRYLEVDGTTFMFSKSKKYNGWIVKAI